MRNFVRALRFAWPYRGRLFFSILCALLAAALWSLTFTAIYPVQKILGSDKNLQQYINDSIRQTNDQIVDLQREIDRLSVAKKEFQGWEEGKGRNDRLRGIDSQLAKTESRIDAARRLLYREQVAKRFIDLLFPEGRFDTLALLIGLVVLAVAIKGLFEFGHEWLIGSVVNLSLYDLRRRFFRNVLRLDVTHFGEAGTHELMARFTNDMEMLGQGQKTLFGKVISEPLKALGCVIAACWISWQLTLMFLVLVPVALFVLTKVGRVMKRATRRLLERMSNIYKILLETFQGIRIVKAFTREPHERRRFRQATRDYYHKSMWVVKLDALSGPIIELLGVAAVAAALLAGAYLVIEKETHLFGLRMSDYPLDAETLLTLYAFLAAVADPVRKLSSVYTRIQSGAAACDRIFAVLDRMPRVQINPGGVQLSRHHKDIELRDVCFSYDLDHQILTGLSFHVRFGETIALVGQNGCGKTTLMGLLARFYDPDHGTISVDGHDLRKVNLRSFRKQLGIVTQEPILFDDTLFNNIAYGNRHASVEEVEAAARQANAHDFIVKLPKGYQTTIGEAGGKMSGGQKQRVALARAILRDPSLLILDEFTSQADTESEVLIHRALREFKKDRTTFVITHRLNTLEIADRILVLEGGRLAALGTHQELWESCPLYRRLCEAQFSRLVA
jgi:ATP-binding cassette subfamily B protein/subfamily B ATP-binding cassette protein MsbA